MVNTLESSAVDRGFDLRSGQTKDYKTGISCFSSEHASKRTGMQVDFFVYNIYHHISLEGRTGP